MKPSSRRTLCEKLQAARTNVAAAKSDGDPAPLLKQKQDRLEGLQARAERAGNDCAAETSGAPSTSR